MIKTIDISFRINSIGDISDSDTYLNLMGKYNIDYAVIVPTEQAMAVYNKDGNDLMIDMIKKHPEKIGGYAIANPWYGEKAVNLLKDAFERGLSGLYMAPQRQGFKLSEEIIYPLIDVCSVYNKPVYCCTGTPVFSMPFQLAELAQRFPNVSFIMGHCAWSDFWYDVIPAAKQAENIFIDTSCTTGEAVSGIIAELGSERVVFSSGCPRSHPIVELNKIKRLDLEENDLTKIMFMNNSKIFGIEI